VVNQLTHSPMTPSSKIPAEKNQYADKNY